MLLSIPISFDAPPEGGWGWVVVFASWAAHVIVLGLQYSFGVLYRALLAEEEFSKGDRGATSWTGSIAVAVMLASGVLVGHATQRYGHRNVALVGSVLVPLGLLTSSFVPTLPWLYLTYGILTGIGFACSFQPSVMIISRYFVKRRALATGIAVSGSGVGTLIFAVWSDLLLQRIGWRGTLQVFALVSLIVLALAAVTYVPVLSNPVSPASSCVAVEVSVKAGKAEAATTPMLTATAETADAFASIESAPLDPEPVLVSSASSLSPAVAGSDVVVTQPQLVEAETESIAKGTDPAMKVVPPVLPLAHTQHPKLTMRQVWTHADWVPIGAVLFVYGGGLFSVYGHLVVAAGTTDGGLSSEWAARLVSWVGLAGMAGRVIFGRIQDNPRVDRVLLLWITLSIAGLSVFGMAFLGPGSPGWDASRVIVGPDGARDTARVMDGLDLTGREALWTVFAVLFGLFSGGVVSQVPPLMVDGLGLENLPMSQGASYTIQAPAVLLGPPSAGWARAAAGNYYGTLLFIGLSMTLSPFLLRYMPIYKRRREAEITRQAQLVKQEGQK
jgi:MFS family permease